MGGGYGEAQLANPAAIKQQEDIKYSSDQHDAFFPAKQLILDAGELAPSTVSNPLFLLKNSRLAKSRKA